MVLGFLAVFLTPVRPVSPGKSSSTNHEESSTSASYDFQSSPWQTATPKSYSLLHSDGKKKTWSQQRAGSDTQAKPKLNVALPKVPVQTYSCSDLDDRQQHGTPTSLQERISLQSHPQPRSLDWSQSTAPELAEHSESNTLQELAHVVRLSKYQERKRADARIHLQRHLISTALSARLTRCGDAVHRNLVDCFRKDDKDGFSLLFNAIQDVKYSCDELRRYALLEPDLKPASPPIFGSSEHLDTMVNPATSGSHLRTMTSFLHDVSASSRKALLDFLIELRSNPEYLASRICALSSSELNAFLNFHKGMEPVESVLPFHGRTSTRYHASASKRGSTSLDIERLLSFQRHDPLCILIHSCFANSSGPDSSEDRRRTDIWATVLAKLVQQPKSNSEQFLICVLNIWIGMRDWSGKPSMEWYLMKLLEEGAFILDRAEDQHGTRFNLSDWNPADEAAAKEFYDKAAHGLFELVDDDDQTGIPDGLLELGNAILAKLDRKYVESTSRWLVWRCLFSVFLLGVIIHPESYGMLAEYHITPYAREKILKKVAMQAYDYVSSIWSGKPSAAVSPADVPPRIRGHVRRILSRFQGSQSKTYTAKLLPARSVTSLRETVEVRPYLLLSPPELVTLVNALFPERRPMSSLSSTLRSGAASISGLSTLSSQELTSNTLARSRDAASLSSTSFSSGVSDGTTTALQSPDDEQLSEHSLKRSPLLVDPDAQRRANQFEDDGYRLRLAVHELSQSMGTEALQGLCHPCAERWAILFISPDGKALSTKMIFDQYDAGDDDGNSTETDRDGSDHINDQELDQDHSQLRDAILRLVEDYEIPCSLESQSQGSKLPQLTNRTSRTRNKPITKHKSGLSWKSSQKAERAGKPAASDVSSFTYPDINDEEDEDEEPVLIRMLKAASLQSKAQEDFVSAHLYWTTLQNLVNIDSSSLRANGYAALVNSFSRAPRESLRWSAAALEEYDAWIVWLRQSQERHEGSIDRMMKKIKAVRDKMWFVTDVRNSKEYSHSQDICQALKTMGMPRRWKSLERSRANINGAAGSSFLYRTQSQILHLLAAPEEQGGPNKLSDEQCQMTTSWLQKSDAENFCPGEERIHRFSCEVEKCLSKLVGETIRDAPVLWSSELYRRERAIYDRMRAHERDQTWYSDDGMNHPSEIERHRLGSPPLKTGYVGRDIQRNTSRSPSEASRINFTRPASISDVVDGNDYFGRSSPVHTFDTISTFWSPFQSSLSPGSVVSRTCSPTTSSTNLSTTFSGSLHHAPLPSNSSISTGRPGTSASSNDTIFQQHAESEKTRFLRELRQTLTSLLLSDFGSQVLARGSETDQWFQGLGQQCLDRKAAAHRQVTQSTDNTSKETGNKSSTRPRVIEKKKSFTNLRGAGETITDRPSKIAHSGGDDATQPRSDGGLYRRTHDGAVLFPFKKSYRRLLSNFAVNPNPIAKLRALNELQKLITTSLFSQPLTKATGARSNLPRDDDNDILMPKNPPDGAINGIRERRSHVATATQQPRKYTHQFSHCHESLETRSTGLHGDAKTDIITHEMQNLFRDAGIRPKSLFRDLQLIASFVPPSILDQPECGKALWNAGLAALKLKSEACLTMVEMADEIIATHTWSRKSTSEHAVPAKQKLSENGTLPPASTIYNLEDVGKMWAITAKEGYPTAQRELALFYLSNPEFVERTTLPLSQPRDVFKQAVMERYGRSEKSRGNLGSAAPGGLTSAGVNARQAAPGSSSTGDGTVPSGKEGDVRNDVSLMCVAIHWMEAAEQGGDELATSFLRQNEFMGFE